MPGTGQYRAALRAAEIAARRLKEKSNMSKRIKIATTDEEDQWLKRRSHKDALNQMFQSTYLLNRSWMRIALEQCRDHPGRGFDEFDLQWLRDGVQKLAETISEAQKVLAETTVTPA
jgi:hypothetical protein